MQQAKDELARWQRRAKLLEQRLRNNQQVFVDFESIAKAVSHLIGAKDSDEAIRDALSLIGEGSGLDRIYILKNVPGGRQGGVIDQIHTWTSGDDNVDSPDFHSLPFEVFFPGWLPRLKSGEHIFGSIDSAPDIEHLTLAKQSVVSYLWIPMFFADRWWGVMGLDQTSRDRIWHPKEISGYELLANSIVEFMRREQLETDLRIFQERHEMASQAGQVGVWDWNLQSGRVFVDSSIISLAGIHASEKIQDVKSWEKLFVLDDGLRWSGELNKRISDKEKYFEIEHFLRHKSGRLLEAYSRGKVLYNADGEAIRVLGTTSDITHLKAIQNDLRNARDLAEEGSKAKSEFMAKMSHEIRTPLNSVLGFSTLLMHTELDSEQADYLTKLDMSCKLLMSMVNNILDFSKIEAGKLDLEMKPYDIRESIDNILQVFGDAVIRKGIKMRYSPGKKLPASVITDPLRIQQVLLNLVGNAVKFTEEGSIQVSTTWRQTEPSKGNLRFVVKDTGIGIEPNRLAAIFEPFTQADSSMTRRFGGSGLGLTICRNILQIMGSRLEVKSKVGVGTEFSFELEVEETQSEHLSDSEKVGETTTDTSATLISAAKMEQRAKVKILLAEDNALNQQVITKLLNRLGYNAVLVEDGKEAVDALNRWDFDLVIMDIMMPVLDGISAAKIIRETVPPAKQPVIIALTANSSDEDIDNCMAVGMNDFLSKPVEIETLEKTLTEHLNLSCAPVDPEQGSLPENAIPFSKIQLEEEESEEDSDKPFKHFDPEYMRNMIGSRSQPEVQDEFLIDTIGVFLESTEDLIKELNASFKEKRWKDFELAAHNLKGTAKTVGGLILGNLALQLELWVQENRSGDREDEVQQVAEEYVALRKELKRFRSGLLEKRKQIS